MALLLVLLCSALGLLPTLTGASAEPPPTLDRDAATQLLTLVNTERTSRGLVPLVDDPALRGWAERWSLHMGTTGVLAHNDALFTRSAHQSLGIKVFAENVAWDDKTFGVLGAHKQFVDSPHHHDNMLGPSYRLAGFAVARDSAGKVWATEDFGTPRVAAPVVRPPAPPGPRPAPRVVAVPVTAPRRPSTASRTRTTPAVPTSVAPVVRRVVSEPAPRFPVARDRPESPAPATGTARMLPTTAGGAARPLWLLLAPLVILGLSALVARRVQLG